MGILLPRRQCRQVRRVFNAEAVVVATAGWTLGSLLGYALFLGLAFVKHDFGITFVKVFPLVSPAGGGSTGTAPGRGRSSAQLAVQSNRR